MNYEEKLNYCVENEIKKIIMFIKEDKNILSFQQIISQNQSEIELIGVSFPANEQIFFYNDQKDEVDSFVPPAADGNKLKKLLDNKGVKLITGALPFEGIVIPGDNFNPYKIVQQTLSMVDPALPLLVQAVLMATDNGIILPGERVLAVSLKSSLDTQGTNTRYLFHPELGMKINKILE